MEVHYKIWIFCFCCIFISVIFGYLIGWLIATFVQQKRFLKKENQYVNHEQVLKATLRDLEAELNLCHQMELQYKQKDHLLSDFQKKLFIAEERVASLACLRQEYDNLNNELKVQLNINNCQEAELKIALARLEDIKSVIEERERLLVNDKESFTTQFENLANRIVERNNSSMDKQNKLSLEKLLIPLREQIDNFRQLIQESFYKEERERHTLSHEVHNLQNLSVKMFQETINLTKALKGNNKIQGSWGEMILHKVLESSGMREGYEFHTQAQFKQDDGRKSQPDVVVHLPKDKDVIIDSKMSLVAYERYFNGIDEMDRQSALEAHINSLKSHIKLLGKKNYEQLIGLRSLDFVLLFVPIETALVIAIDACPELINEALSRNIILVGPSTLLVALRIINNIWRYEYQNRNAQKIAKKASRLYDKIRLFVDDFNKIGLSIDKLQANYQLAKKKLFEGTANIISQVEGFRCLGVEVKNPIITDNLESVILTTGNSCNKDLLEKKSVQENIK
ncbi:DNA recombination protein RmuC [Blochmannia endosymbiont of Colobopsis nipponica]|uniref:DNA recombination protein RmuC n=1 Tax=Blochmannia endosymbiont of Colobopsis nipponica TaxID=2681987 RepID=UPI001786F04B|nr:DNA recombination protein RmuC [Blochmannia endosymbiont of Colobopsis nipponica]QOI10850.1 DNA recombination protein RmuC [Blochmannia endosymbiont of Colobopsis nipponica]